MAMTIRSAGLQMPALGFGTWDLRGDQCCEAVAKAVEVGYRHIDTAQIYDNEAEVGRGIRGSRIPRQDIFVTTKIWIDCFEPDKLRASLEQSLVRLDMDHVDLALVHWPNPNVPLRDTLDALAKAKRAGLCRHIGVSNFTTALLTEALSVSAEPIAVNQIEYHPYIRQAKLLSLCRTHDVAVTAYCPIARGQIFTNEDMLAIAARHKKSVAQVALRWLIQQEGVAALPRSGNPAHIASNFAIFDFELSDYEMARISMQSRPGYRLVDPQWAPSWDSEG